ncbi:MAG: D-glycerate 3-kinase [Arenicella sp.]|jgi:D-glycerate 3-kinase
MAHSNSQLESLINSKIVEQGLPNDFCKTITNYYMPLAGEIALAADQSSANVQTPLLVGVFGSQGSGKSTFADFLRLILEQEFNTSTVVMSLDDFYHTRQQRQYLSAQIHPLLVTRGVPGTHDIQLLQDTLEQLRRLDSSELVKLPVRVPIFNKANDDRAPLEQWQTISSKPKVVILEGWCVGIKPQSDAQLTLAINNLERTMDSDGGWRKFVNQQLKQDYATVFSQFDKLIALVVPSFDCVYEWRSLQEAKLIETLERAKKSTQATMSDEQMTLFIAHYQRLTEHALATLPGYADWCLHIDKSHQITGLTAISNATSKPS